MSPTTLPSYDEVSALPLLLEGEVTADFIDANGHMNIRHYLDAGAFGADVLCRAIGIDDAYRSDRRLGVFTAEHHIRYFSEMHLGTKFSGHSVLVERSSKTAHLLSFVVDRDNERLACTVEIMLVGVGMDTRRPADFPGDVADRMDDLVRESGELDWPLPLSGSIRVRTDSGA